MNKIQSVLLAIALLALPVGLTSLTGCATRLESGGAYAPVVTNIDGSITETADMPLYAADASAKFAISILDTAFTYERENRIALWNISPKIKQTMDAIRPKAVDARRRWALARQAYLLTPPQNRKTDSIDGIVGELQALASAVQAGLAVKTVTSTK